MALALDAGNVGTWDYDVRKRLAALVRNGYDMFGMTPGADVGLDDFYAAMHPDDREATREALLAVDRPGPARRHRRRVPHGRPRRRQGALDLGQVAGASSTRPGKPARVVGWPPSTSPNARRPSCTWRLLVNELNHRVKNSLATIQAIAAQDLPRRPLAALGPGGLLGPHRRPGRGPRPADPRELGGGGPAGPAGPAGGPARRAGALHDRGRVGAAVAAHGPVAVDGPARAGDQRGQVRARCPRRQGQVRISWTVVPGGAHPRLVLTWTETGGPPVSPPSRRGFGSRLIERGLAGGAVGRGAHRLPAGRRACAGSRRAGRVGGGHALCGPSIVAIPCSSVSPALVAGTPGSADGEALGAPARHSPASAADRGFPPRASGMTTVI